MPKGQTPKVRKLRKTVATVNKIRKNAKKIVLSDSFKKHGRLKKVKKFLGPMSKGRGK